MADIDAASAVKLFKGAGIVVRVPKLDKDGEAVRDPETKRFIPDAQTLSAEHVIGIRDLGGKVSITTLDGQKYEAAKTVEKVKE